MPPLRFQMPLPVLESTKCAIRSQKKQQSTQNKVERAKMLKASALAFSGDATPSSAVSSIMSFVKYPTRGAPKIAAAV